MTPKEIATEFANKCKELGFTFTVGKFIVSVHKSFPAGDLNAFVECDMTGPFLLMRLKQTEPGSVWGTDGGGVGGQVAVNNGRYTLNKSGIGKRIINEIKKL